ncbi:uncharacterized protein LOC114575785 [Exaiptasia diaphana]|uniref:Uncharacterized protein n=1 Tax=Exaiptasia diaphana TaxID=2652724 RepID=A0A913YPX9_EXADI|nr:uncharacterized protein LOC114575785 [Exaiptasia diaphana]
MIEQDKMATHINKHGRIFTPVTAITKSLRNKLDMTHKKISQAPLEQLNSIWKVDEYLDVTQGICPTKLHFFDESSVIKTTSNRLYGNSYKGSKAIEVQRYASNASYTVNLLHSIFGVDYFNVIPGASNSEQLITFFDFALDSQRDNGLPVFIEGDVSMVKCRITNLPQGTHNF